jgi:primosomal protein N' (replication factor Y)
MAADVRVGSLVRVPLHGRRVAGWVVSERASGDAAGRALKPLLKVSSWGPPASVVALTEWAAWRWAGRRSSFLRAASPPVMVRGIPAPAPGASRHGEPGVQRHVAPDRTAQLWRLPPATDLGAFVEGVVREHGPALVLAPTHADAAAVARHLRDSGVPVAALPREWAKARAGGWTVVGARAAAWAPVGDDDAAGGLGAIVVLDGHDEAYQDERAPTWHATDVAVERARRAGVPCIVTSPCPDVGLLAWQEPVTPPRKDEREGWPVADVLDRRADDPRSGLYGERLVATLRRAERAVCILNRKGRARLLACAACGEVARCEACSAAVVEAPAGEGPSARASGLACMRCRTGRPKVCTRCGATRMKALRVGVARAREELEAILQRPVAEVTGATDDRDPLPRTPVVIGTEAVLHRISPGDGVDVIAFLDLDQELLAPRYRAAEEALALLARAARVLGGRVPASRPRSAAGGVGRLVLQTRLPHHEVVEAALHGDPARVAEPERERRRALRFPPYAAIAAVSGPAAAELAGRVAATGVEVLGPSDGRWLVRAGDSASLADAFEAAGRPSGRVRVEVDPRRL